MPHIMTQTINSGSLMASSYLPWLGIGSNLRKPCRDYCNKQATDSIEPKFLMPLAIGLTPHIRVECQNIGDYIKKRKNSYEKTCIVQKIIIYLQKIINQRLQNALRHLNTIKVGKYKPLKNIQMTNIGHKIKEVLEAQNHSPLWLAERLERSKASVYDILKKDSINTRVLESICKILHHDFFEDLSMATKHTTRNKLTHRRKSK